MPPQKGSYPMKSMSSVLIRITLVVLFCLGMFVTANSVPAGQRDKHERRRCERECQDRYNQQKRECKNRRGDERRRCEREAKNELRDCKQRCKGGQRQDRRP